MHTRCLLQNRHCNYHKLRNVHKQKLSWPHNALSPKQVRRTVFRVFRFFFCVLLMWDLTYPISIVFCEIIVSSVVTLSPIHLRIFFNLWLYSGTCHVIPLVGMSYPHPITKTKPNPNHPNHFAALFRDHLGEPVPDQNFGTLWCKGRLTEADTPTIRLGATPSRLTSAHLHHPPIFFGGPDALPAAQPTVSKHWRQA